MATTTNRESAKRRNRFGRRSRDTSGKTVASQFVRNRRGRRSYSDEKACRALRDASRGGADGGKQSGGQLPLIPLGLLRFCPYVLRRGGILGVAEESSLRSRA